MQLPKRHQGGVMFGGGSNICGSKQTFPDIWSTFKKNLNGTLYIASRGYSQRKIMQNGALLVTIHILAALKD